MIFSMSFFSARGEVLLAAEEGLYVNSHAGVNKNFLTSAFFL
jgi:hypothetical protein